jgi:hypothetical protein
MQKLVNFQKQKQLKILMFLNRSYFSLFETQFFYFRTSKNVLKRFRTRERSRTFANVHERSRFTSFEPPVLYVSLYQAYF